MYFIYKKKPIPAEHLANRLLINTQQQKMMFLNTS
jgi:hypothetical protein